MVAPIVAVLVMAIKGIFGIEIGEGVQSQVVDAVVILSALVVSIVGIYKDNQKKDESNVQ